MGHYELRPQRGCFLRCERCYNLSEADSYEKDGIWYHKPECLFCVQRAIDALGYYEHGIVPEVFVSPDSKTRNAENDKPSFISALEQAALSLED